MGRKYIPVDFKSVTRICNDNRAVSPLIAVALLVLVSVGFVVAIEGAGSDFLYSVQQPPDANVNANPGGQELRITVGGVTNADELEVRIDGTTISAADLNTSSGSTVLLDWSGSAGTGRVDVSGDVDEGASLITVTAIDLPDNEATVYSYEVPA